MSRSAHRSQSLEEKQSRTWLLRLTLYYDIVLAESLKITSYLFDSQVRIPWSKGGGKGGNDIRGCGREGDRNVQRSGSGEEQCAHLCPLLLLQTILAHNPTPLSTQRDARPSTEGPRRSTPMFLKPETLRPATKRFTLSVTSRPCAPHTGRAS